MENNKGFSLIELIIVISIVAIMTGFLAIGISSAFGLGAKECARKIDSYLKETKTISLSKDKQELTIYQHSNGKYYADFVVYKLAKDPDTSATIMVPSVTRTEEIGKKNVTITCFFADGSSVVINGSNSVTLGFNRSSGAFEPAKKNNATTSTYCEKIEVTRSGRKTTVSIIPQTGKISVN